MAAALDHGSRNRIPSSLVWKRSPDSLDLGRVLIWIADGWRSSLGRRQRSLTAISRAIALAPELASNERWASSELLPVQWRRLPCQPDGGAGTWSTQKWNGGS